MTELELIAAILLYSTMLREDTLNNLFTALMGIASCASILFYIGFKIWSSVI